MSSLCPIVRQKNSVLLMCVIMVYYFRTLAIVSTFLLLLETLLTLFLGKTNTDECFWLVFWKTKIIVQILAGTLIIYTSALLLHFNVDINGKHYLLSTSCSN